MISRSLKAALIGCSSLLVLPLSGCMMTGTDKPAVQVQHAVAKSVNTGNRYIIKQAALRTPGTDRLQQSQRQAVRDTVRHNSGVATTARPTAKRSAVNHQQQARQRREAEILRQQQVQRAKYHARYQVQQQKQAQQQAQQRRLAQRPPPDQKTAKPSPSVRQQKVAQQQRQQLAQQARIKQTQQPQPNRADTAAAKRQFYLARWERQQAEKRLAAQQAEQRVERVIHNAKKQIGRKYVWGGASPKTGFDCSGLVQHSIKEGADVKVPRTAAEQYRAAVKVPEHQASRGDLVFFKTRGNSVSHVGIYLGENRFIHAPRTGLSITKSDLSGYWKQRFVGFGRIPGACKVPV